MYDEVADVSDEQWTKLCRRLLPGVGHVVYYTTPRGPNWLSKWMDAAPGGILETDKVLTPEQMERIRGMWDARRRTIVMNDSKPKVDTRPCGDCEAPVDANGPKHQGAGDCRAAQRKEIRRLRGENEQLRGDRSEKEKMNSPWLEYASTSRSGRVKMSPLVVEYVKRFRAGLCTCSATDNCPDEWRGRRCARHIW